MKLALTLLGLVVISNLAQADVVEWQWMIDHPLRLNNVTDMGTGKTAWNGNTAPATDPVVYDIDGWDNPVATVDTLHAMGKKVICYIEVGAAENYRPDWNLFPKETLGKTLSGYASERYIDIRDPRVVAIVKARIKMCADKHFDAIEPDLDESYAVATGFPLTQAIAVAYMQDLANYTHSLGMAFGAKNPDDTGDDYATKLEPFTDFVLTEQCNQYNSCGLLGAYDAAGKAVFNAEYNISLSSFCPKDNAKANWNGTKFPVSLRGGRKPCK